jgi:DNA modification methylase
MSIATDEDGVKTFCGDCIEVMAEIPENSVDMVLCDLPYGTTRNKWDTVIPFDDLWSQWKRCTRHGAAIVLFGQEPFASRMRMSNQKWYRYDWTWHKPQGTGFLNAKRMPLKDTETLSVFYDSLPTYHPQMRKGFKPYVFSSSKGRLSSNYGAFNPNFVRKSDGERYPVTTLDFNYDRGSRIHPTQKPVALCEYMIRTYTDPGETVLDCCMGSGSTGVAAINAGRRFIGIEKDHDYYTAAVSRIESEGSCK